MSTGRMSRKADAGEVRRGRSLLPAATIALISAVAAACETSSQVTAGPTPDKCSVTLSAASTVDAAGGTTSFALTTLPECDWAAVASVDWISGLSPASGQGSATVQFRVASNDGTAPREGDIVVQEQRLRVSQRAPCRFDLAPASQQVSAPGGAGSITVATSSECTWTATSTVSWMSLVDQGTGTGNGTVRFTVASNAGSERTGAIVIGGRQATVTQTGNTAVPPPAPSGCSYAVSPESQNIGVAGGGAQVSVSTSSGCTWSAGSSVPWIAVTSGASGSGAGTVSVSVAGNTGGARTGTLTIAGRTAAITQAACTYTIAPTTQSVGAGAGAVTPITVTTASTCSWTAGSNAGWISVSSTAARAGSGSVGVSVAANTGGSRTGSLTVAGLTSTVSQAGCTYQLSPTDQTVAAGGASGAIEVTAPAGCSWTSRSNAAWVSIESGQSGGGSGRVEYRVEQNTGGSRTTTISIADQTFTVTQRAP
jgi:hypothetical protein